MNLLKKTTTVGLLLAVLIGVQSFDFGDSGLDSFPLTIPTYIFGLEQERYASIEEQKVPSGTTLSQLLSSNSDDVDLIANLQATALQVMDETRLVAGKPLTIFKKDGEENPDVLVYEPNGYEQILFDFAKGLTYTRSEQVTTQILKGQGSIQSSLWNAVTDQGHSAKLALGVQRAIESAVSLRALDKGDSFQMIYEKKFVNKEDKGVGKVKAVQLKHGGRDIIAIHFEHPEEGINGYYSLEGENLSSGFLLSPVPGARISSAYNLRRFHPILKRIRPHYGTDYAARRGTPILSVADGKVVEVSRNRGNGRYVKIRHDDTYSTQYLHMSGFAKGLKPGQYVNQGQVIGYVGSSGLSTGPHVCFRFWRNGKQVNHLNQNLPKGKPLPDHLIKPFKEERDALLEMLDISHEESNAANQEA